MRRTCCASSGSSTPPYAEWALLANADVWSCYRLGVGADRHAELVFRVSLLDSTPAEEKAHLFYHLCKEGVQDGSLQNYWERVRVLNPGRIAAMLLSDDVLNLLRRELQRTANYRIDAQTLDALLTREILRPGTRWPRGTVRTPRCRASPTVSPMYATRTIPTPGGFTIAISTRLRMPSFSPMPSPSCPATPGRSAFLPMTFRSSKSACDPPISTSASLRRSFPTCSDR